MYKLQITLTPEVHTILEERSSRLGFDVTRYAKLILNKEAMEQVESTEKLRLTPKAIKDINQSFKEYREGKAHKIKKSLTEII